MIYAHVVHERKGILTKLRMQHVPSVGDELRLEENLYVTVTRIIWCLDEHYSDGVDRVNVGVEDSNAAKTGESTNG